MKDKYDVIIVGGGPAGLFAALELSQASDLSVLVLEKGKDIDRRHCPVRSKGTSCILCSPCNLVSGLGGAGAFSDGKLTISSEIGGHLTEYLGKEQTDAIVKYVDDVYLRFGAGQKLYGVGTAVNTIGRRAAEAGLHLVPMPVRHLGTEHCRAILKSMRDCLSRRVEFGLREAAARIIVEDGEVKGIETAAGDRLSCRYLLVAPGREGADWLSSECNRLHLTLNNNPVDVGVRVEVPAATTKELTDTLHEAKLEFRTRGFDDRIRTFCMCPYGEVSVESTGGDDPVISVNGHSYAHHKTENTNFALLMSTNFTEPFHEPIAYGKYLARLANLLAGGVLVQRLGDLLDGHRSTPTRMAQNQFQPTLKAATPGDLSFVLPYRHLTGIIEMLRALDKLAPGVAAPSTLLYGIEVKFYSIRPKLTTHLETEVRNMFAAGDGAGISRGLVQASASGIVAAREILHRSGHS